VDRKEVLCLAEAMMQTCAFAVFPVMHPELHEAAVQLGHERQLRLRLRDKQRMLEKTSQV
jgi:hypothetical protein